MLIFKRELKNNFKSFITWTIIILLLTSYVAFLYPSMKDSADLLMKKVPEALRGGFGLNEMNIGNIIGFFGLASYLYITILGNMFVTILASNIISKEQGDKTIEFLIGKPITRKQIYLNKVLLVFFYSILMNIIVFGVNLGLINIIAKEKYSIKVYLLLFLGSIMLNIFFVSLGSLISVFIRRTKKAMSLSVGVVLGFYVVKLISSIGEKGEFLKYFTPFAYFDNNYIINNESIKGIYVFLTMFLSIIFLTYGLVYYIKKDIYV